MDGAASWITAAATAIGAVAAGVAVAVAYVQLKAFREQDIQGRKTQLSALYLQRYWEIDAGLLINSKSRRAHRRQVHRLLILTEDEFDAARSGLLDLAYWEKWHE